MRNIMEEVRPYSFSFSNENLPEIWIGVRSDPPLANQEVTDGP